MEMPGGRLSTAMLPNGWAASINARGNRAKGTTAGISAAVESTARGGAIFPIFVRMAMDQGIANGDVHYR